MNLNQRIDETRTSLKRFLGEVTDIEATIPPLSFINDLSTDIHHSDVDAVMAMNLDARQKVNTAHGLVISALRDCGKYEAVFNAAESGEVPYKHEGHELCMSGNLTAMVSTCSGEIFSAQESVRELKTELDVFSDPTKWAARRAENAEKRGDVLDTLDRLAPGLLGFLESKGLDVAGMGIPAGDRPDEDGLTKKPD
jgi:hypothetical protein